MPAVEYDFELDQGASWSRVFTYLQPGTQVNGVDQLDGPPVDLTGGWAAAMDIKAYKSASAPLASATCVINGSGGTITASLTRAQTAAMPAKTPVFYDLVIYKGPVLIRLVEGQITFDRAVTEVA